MTKRQELDSLKHELDVMKRRAEVWEARANKAEGELATLRNTPKAVLLDYLRASEKRIAGCQE
jgi:hypothetical protein